MIQKDYIMRMIEQMTNVLAEVLLLKKDGSQIEALRETDNFIGNTIGIDPVLLDTLSIDDSSELLGISKDKSTGSMKCILAGRLLKEKADILSMNNQNKSIEYCHKALCLYLKGLMNIGYTETDLTTFYEDVKTIEEDLGNSISNEEKQLLVKFYTKAEQ
jgi:hypothetical protein